MFTRSRRLADFFSPKQLADPDTEWSRLRLQILLGVTVVVALALVAGGAWSVVNMLTGSTASAGSGSEAGQSAQDELAEQELPEAPVEAAQPGSLSSGETGTIEIRPVMDTSQPPA